MSHIRQNDDAMTASVPSPVASTPPLPLASPSPSSQQSQGDDRFDNQLDAARRQQQPRQDTDPSSDDSNVPTTKGKTASTDGDKKTTRAGDDKSQDDSDDTSLASTMLQLLGQSAPPADPSTATAQSTPADPTAANAAPAGMSALALTMPQTLPATDAQATKDPAATNAQAKLAAIPTSVLPTMPKLADLGKAGATDGKADDKAGDDDWHHVIANATNKTSNATATATTKAVQTTETAPTDLPQVATHKDNDITAMLGLASGPGSVTHTAQPQVLQMQSSVDSSGFAQELGQQVAWMGGQDIKEARIKLNPEALGELEVKVSVDHNRVDVAFAAQHPAAVTAVQQTLGQLDTMLAGHGLSLGHTFVGQQHQGSDGSSSSSGKGSFAGNDAADGDAEVSPIRQVAVGLVDMFA